MGRFWPSVVAGVLGGSIVIALAAVLWWSSTIEWLGGPSGLASWVQAVGSVAAVGGALWIALNANAVQRRRDAEARTAIITAAYMMIHNVRNNAEKSYDCLKSTEKTLFWKAEAGGFMEDLYQQMNRLPIHETTDLMVMGAFENARSMLTVITKMHRTIASADEKLDGYGEYVSRASLGMSAMAQRCALLERAVATKLPQVPESAGALFSDSELNSIFGTD